LEGKSAYVSGAGKGIGRAIVMALLKEGVNVTGLTRTVSDLNSLEEASQSLSGEFLNFPGDISDEATVEKSINQTVEKFGRLDFLINNAGIGIIKPVQELSIQDWDDTMNINLRGTFLATHFALPHMMKATGGSIINIASIAGKRGFAGGGAYSASKHAMLGFTESLMLDIRKYNIRVLSICPGSVATHFHLGDAMNKEEGKVLTSEDCAETVLYALRLPQSATAHQIELRITNP
jgi:3-oxoacyl-[acyl-carrier protein] reductase